MDVLITFGRHAGQIRDIEPSAALDMLKDGRAKRPGEELDPAPAAEVSEVTPHLVGESATELTTKSSRRSRR